MNDRQWPELFEVAARASIIERCATSFLHEVRGSMHALFSAIELLSRSAKGSGDRERIDRACELARRATDQHEKTTLHAMEALTQRRIDASAFDVGPLLGEVVHLLRNEATHRAIHITVNREREANMRRALRISAERGRLQTLLLGLLTAALDALPTGATLPVSLGRSGGDAVIRIGCDAGFASVDVHGDDRRLEEGEHAGRRGLATNMLTLLFARRFLNTSGGRLEITAAGAVQGQPHSGGAPQSPGELRIVYPMVAAFRPFAQ